jgi:hypothetical protein
LNCTSQSPSSVVVSSSLSSESANTTALTLACCSTPLNVV